ncbi:hypothetical protein B0H13DRAFT_1934883, partial [Mycena leptocephala]
MAPKQQQAPKNPRSKAVTAPVEDDFQGETIEVSDPRATVWAFFDNDACRRFVALFNEDIIDNTPVKTVASILRDALPSFQAYYHKKPSLLPEHIAFLYAASRAAQFAIEAHPKHVKEQEFAKIVNVYSSRVKELRRKQSIAAARPGFIIPRVTEPPGGSGFAASDDEMEDSFSVPEVENESFIVDPNDDEEEEEVPAPKRPRREVVSFQASPPRNPSHCPAGLDQWHRPPGSLHPRWPFLMWRFPRANTNLSLSRRHHLLLRTGGSGDAPHFTPGHVARNATVCPPGDWVRMNAQPLPAMQLVPTSFVQDGLVPALYSK